MNSLDIPMSFKNSPYFPTVYSRNPLNILFSIDQFLTEYFLTSPQRTKSSEYKLQLQEKKKFCLFYGHLSKNQLRKYVRESEKIPGEFSKNLIHLVERRLDVVLYRSHFARSIVMARQWITHKQVRVNQKLITNPGYQMQPGDVITGNWNQTFSTSSTVSPIKFHFESWNFDKKHSAKPQLDTFLHLLLKKIQTQIDERLVENQVYVYTKKRSQVVSAMWKSAVFYFLSNFSLTDLEKSIFFQNIRKYSRRISTHFDIKPSHLEISPKISTVIFLYSPQRVYYPFLIDFDLLKKAAMS